MLPLKTVGVYPITVALSTNTTRDCVRRIEIGPVDKGTQNPLNFEYEDAVLHILHADRHTIWGRAVARDEVTAIASLHSFQAFNSVGWRHTITEFHIPELETVFAKDDAFTKTRSLLQILDAGYFVIHLPTDAPKPRGHLAGNDEEEGT